MAPVKERGGGGEKGSFSSPPPSFIFFLALVPFLARPKPKIPFLGLSLFRNQTEKLATQARQNTVEPPFATTSRK